MKKILLALSIALVLGLSGCPYTIYKESPILYTPIVLSSSSIQISWLPVTKTIPLSTWYRITRVREDGETMSYDTAPQARTWTDINLDAGTRYSYTVIAKTTYGESWDSNKQFATTLENLQQTLPRPSNVRAEVASDNPRDIVLSWDECLGATTYNLYGGPTEEYELPPTSLLATIDGNTSCILYGQATTLRYVFYIKAFNDTDGSFSKTSEFIEYNHSYVDTSTPTLAALIRPTTKEYFKNYYTYYSQDFWAWFSPAKAAFTLSISSPDIVFRVFKEQADHSLSYLGYGNQATPLSLRDSTLIGSHILILMFQISDERPLFYIELSEDD